MLLVSFSNPAHKRFEGQRMSDVIKTLGRPGIDVLFELLEANRGSVPTVYFHHSEEDMRFALRQPWVSIGSDGTAVKAEGPLAAGHPHPRYYGTFPRVLGRYVREDKVLTLEEAVQKMTGNAAKIHQWDRVRCAPAWRRHYLQRHHHRQCHLRKASPVPHGCRVRHRERSGRVGERLPHRRAPGPDTVLPRQSREVKITAELFDPDALAE
jgi:hypothetical protein